VSFPTPTHFYLQTLWKKIPGQPPIFHTV
jgi:hypothetical protein